MAFATRRGRVAKEDWTAVRTHLDALQIDIDPLSATRTWRAVLDLADRYGISGYDAMYLELAVRMHLPLASLDQRLRAAGRSAGVDVLRIDD